jgi:hypothetical protein
MIVDFLIGFVVAFVVWLVFLFCCIPVFMEGNIDNPFTETKWFPIITAIILLVCIVGSILSVPYQKQIDIENLKVKYDYNLGNVLNLANSMNEKVIIKTENDRIIIDVANLSQSTITSSVYIDYVNQVNIYNKELAEFKVKSRKGFMNKLYYGLYPELPDDIKYIKIKL